MMEWARREWGLFLLVLKISILLGIGLTYTRGEWFRLKRKCADPKINREHRRLEDCWLAGEITFKEGLICSDIWRLQRMGLIK